MERQRAREWAKWAAVAVQRALRAKAGLGRGTAGPKWPEVKVCGFFIFQKQILMHIFDEF
jgi:hypothetical protein